MRRHIISNAKFRGRSTGPLSPKSKCLQLLQCSTSSWHQKFLYLEHIGFQAFKVAIARRDNEPARAALLAYDLCHMITDTIQQLMTLFMLIAIELEFDTLKSSNYVSIIQLLGVLANRHLPLLLIAAVVPISARSPWSVAINSPRLPILWEIFGALELLT